MGLAPERTPTGSVYRSLTGSIELRPGGVAPPPVEGVTTYCYALELTRVLESQPPTASCGVDPDTYCKTPVPTFVGYARYEFSSLFCYTHLVPRNFPLKILDAQGNTLITLGAWTCVYGDQTWPDLETSEVVDNILRHYDGVIFDRIFGLYACLENPVSGMPPQNTRTIGLEVTIAEWTITSIDADLAEVYIEGTSHLSFLDGVSISGTANNDGLYEVQFADDEFNYIEVYPDLTAEDPIPLGAKITFIGPGLYSQCLPYTSVTDLGGGLIRFAVAGHTATVGQVFGTLDSSVYSLNGETIVAVATDQIDVVATFAGDDAATCGTGTNPFQS